MERMRLSCGRFIPREGSGAAVELAVRVAMLEWYLARLSEELEVLVGQGGAVVSAWSGAEGGQATVGATVEETVEETVEATDGTSDEEKEGQA